MALLLVVVPAVRNNTAEIGFVSGKASEPLKEEEDYMDDILLSTARHFANKFLEHVKGLSVSSFLRQRDQLIKSIQWVTAFGVDCSAFVSQVDDLIQLIDDFNVFSVLVEREDTIQQLENQLSHVGSEDAAVFSVGVFSVYKFNTMVIAQS